MGNSLIQSVADKVLSDSSSNTGQQSQTDMLYVGKSVNTHEIHGYKDPTEKTQQSVKDGSESEPNPPITGSWPYNPKLASSYLPGELTKVIHELGKSPIDKELEQQKRALEVSGIVAVQAMAEQTSPQLKNSGEKKAPDSTVVGKVSNIVA
jgi:hypothetical protein